MIDGEDRDCGTGDQETDSLCAIAMLCVILSHLGEKEGVS